MRRIKTFELFEANEDVHWDLTDLGDQLNARIKDLGMNFDYHNGSFRSYNGPLEREDFSDTRGECEFRSLILPIFFGVSPDDEWSCRILFFDDKENRRSRAKILNWIEIRYADDKKYEVEKNYIMIPRPIDGTSKESGDRQSIDLIIRGILEMLGNVKAMRCSDSIASTEVEADFADVIPSLLPAFAKFIMKDPNGLRDICDAIRGADNHQGGLIRRIKEMKPDLWQKLAPMIGAGTGEIEDLTDLGF